MKIDTIIQTGWSCYQNKVANGLLIPENEKMMQLQMSQILLSLSAIYEFQNNESIKILLEVPAIIKEDVFKSIDIVIYHSINNNVTNYPIELKCFRLRTRGGTALRGAQNLGMYDYWEDIENLENYSKLRNYATGYQLTLTDDPYYVNTDHRGPQVSIYSTNKNRKEVTGTLERRIANRNGRIDLVGKYSMRGWERLKDFYFIRQKCIKV